MEDQNKQNRSEKKSNMMPVVGVVLLIVIGGGYFAYTNYLSNTQSANVVTEVSTNTITETQEAVVATEGDVMMEEGVHEIVIEGSNFAFSPSTISVAAGEQVKIVFKSNGGFHDFVVEGLEGAATTRVNTGEETTVTFIAPSEPGEYTYFCSVGNHRALGMEGVLTVE